MKDLFVITNAVILWIVLVVAAISIGSGVFYWTVWAPYTTSQQRTIDTNSRQNVVGVQTAMRQDMQDAQRNRNNPALVQQDLYDMERLRDQLPDPNTEVPADIQQFMAANGALV